MTRAMVDPIVIVVAPVGRGRFRASYGGRLLVESSTTPFLDAARVLAGEGVDPATAILMRHEGQSYGALISTIDAAAKLTVKESTKDGKPRFGDWHPYGGPGVPVASPISEHAPDAVGGNATPPQPSSAPGGAADGLAAPEAFHGKRGGAPDMGAPTPDPDNGGAA
jgi:hypothetical protein